MCRAHFEIDAQQLDVAIPCNLSWPRAVELGKMVLNERQWRLVGIAPCMERLTTSGASSEHDEDDQQHQYSEAGSDPDDHSVHLPRDGH